MDDWSSQSQSPQKIWNKLSPNVKGFIFILMASATFPIMGTIVKYLTLELHPFRLAFFRCFLEF